MVKGLVSRLARLKAVLNRGPLEACTECGEPIPQSIVQKQRDDHGHHDHYIYTCKCGVEYCNGARP